MMITKMIKPLFLILFFINSSVFSQLFVDKTGRINDTISGSRKINDDTGTEIQQSIRMDMNKYGRLVICWTDHRSGSPDIYAQYFTHKGNMYPAKNFKVNDDTNNSEQLDPDVAVDLQGGFVVVWTDRRDGHSNVYAQRYKANGKLLGTNFKINDVGEDIHQYNPAIAMDKYGNFVVCWEDQRNPSSFDIYARQFDSDAQPLGPSFQVNSSHNTDCRYAAVDMTENGTFVIVWSEKRSFEFLSVYAQRFDSTGTMLGTDFEVSTHPLQDYHVGDAAVAVQEDGDFMIVWGFSYLSDIGYHSFARPYDSDGNPKKDLFIVHETEPTGNRWYAEICANPLGGYRIVWDTNHRIYARDFDDDGNPDGDSFQVPDTPGPVHDASICIDNRGIGIYVWKDFRDANWDVYAAWHGLHVPLNLTAGSGFKGIVPLTWDPVYGDEEVRKYRIYRSTVSGGFYDLIATVDLSARPLPKLMMDWIDSTVTNGTTYYYRVESDDPDSEGYSAEVSATPAAGGHWLRSSMTYFKPVIDGVFNLNEWYDSRIIDISNPYTRYSIPLYIKYDKDKLYIAVDDSNDTVIDPANLLGILFDENENKRWDATGPSREGMISITSAGAYFTGYWGNYPNALGADLPKPAAGIEYGITTTNGHVQYEVSLDFAASPFNTSPMSSLGFSIWIADPGNSYPYHYGNAGEWPPGALWESALPLGDLVLSVSVIGCYMKNWPMINYSGFQDSWAVCEWQLYPPFIYEQMFNAPFSEQISFYDNTLYVSTFDTSDGNNRTYAFDFKTRARLWMFEIPNSGRQARVTPAVNDSLVFCGAVSGDGLYALDNTTGTERWFKRMGCYHPVLYHDRIYMLTDSLYSLDIKDGRTVWSCPLDGGGSIPTIDDFNVYACAGGQLYAFDRLNGNLRWQVENNGYPSVATDKPYLYTHHSGNIVVREKGNGTIQQTFPITSGDIDQMTMPNSIALTDSFLCFPIAEDPTGLEMQLVTMDKRTGDILWYHQFDSSRIMAPVIANRVAYIVEWNYSGNPSWETRVWGFDLRTGDSLFCDQSQRYLMRPIVAYNTLFVPSYNGVKSFSNLPVSVDDLHSDVIPKRFKLEQNFPNPFNPETSIRFSVKEPCQVVLKIYNILGREVAVLEDKHYQPGDYKIRFRSEGLASGIYFYRIEMGEFRAVRKMVVIE
jgi:hypothetical protein